MSPVSAKNDQEGQEGAGEEKRQESRVAITTNCIVTRKLRDYSVRANHAVHVSSVVAREKEQETLSEYNRDEEKERKRERKRESKLSRSTHNYRLYFQIAACTLAASSNCLRR